MGEFGLYVGAANGNNVRLFDETTGALIGDVTSGAQFGGGYSCPRFGPQGDLFVHEWSYQSSVWRFDGSTGVYKATVVQNVGSPGNAIAFGPDGALYVSGPPNARNRIDRYDPLTGQFLGIFVSAGAGGLTAAEGMRFGPDGNLYVQNVNFPRRKVNVLRYANGRGNFINEFVVSGSGRLAGGGDILFGPDGNLYASDRESNVVRRYNGTSGQFIDNFASDSTLKLPCGLAFGPDGNLYVASGGTDAVLRFDGKTGALIDTFASPTFPSPTYITFGRNIMLTPVIATIPLRRYEMYDWLWKILTRGGLVPPPPPDPTGPWVRQLAAAMMLADDAAELSPELRAEALRIALRQMSVASATIEREIKRVAAKGASAIGADVGSQRIARKSVPVKSQAAKKPRRGK